MANAYFYSNTAVQTTLSGNISNAATSIGVGAVTGFPPSYPYVLALDYGAATEELVVVTAAAGTTLTVTRGFSGTSAQSHSIGAVVRHTYTAQDATDFRTHEAATAAIHGVAGTLVGTSDTQTLSAKTLTSPVINGGALSGTLSGGPDFSGGVTFSGTPTFNNQLLAKRTFVTGATFRASVTGDATDRHYVEAGGKHWWGDGTLAVDTTLYRAAANSLKTDNDFTALGTVLASPASTSKDGLSVNLPTSTIGDLLNLRVNSAIQSAMGSDGAFRIYGGNSPVTFTPAVTNGGSVTWTTRTGYYWKLGKMVYVCVYLVVNAGGSGAGIVSVDMPSNVDRSIRQVLTLHTETIGSGGNALSHIGGGECVFFTSGAGATSDRLRTDEGGGTARENNVTGADLLAGGLITVQGWYREA